MNFQGGHEEEEYVKKTGNNTQRRYTSFTQQMPQRIVEAIVYHMQTNFQKTSICPRVK